LVQRKCEHGGGAGEQAADHNTLEHHARAIQLPEVLQEDHDLEALAVNRCEPQQRQAQQHPAFVRVRI
jgi:hypothetical protein